MAPILLSEISMKSSLESGRFETLLHRWPAIQWASLARTLPLDRVGATAVVVALGLSFSYVAVQSSRLFTLNEYMLGLLPQWDLVGINTIPAWVCAILLLLATGLSGLIGLTCRRVADPLATYWAAGSLVVFIIALGEASSIPSLAGRMVEISTTAFGQWGGGMVVLTGVSGFLIACTPICRTFLSRIPVATQQYLAQAGILLTLATVISASVGERAEIGNDAVDFSRAMRFVTIVQGIKIAGALMLIYALTSYLSRYYESMNTHVRSWGATTTSTSASLPTAPPRS